MSERFRGADAPARSRGGASRAGSEGRAASPAPRDLRGYLLEEAYEVVESIDRGEPGPLCEELGDLLFQIVFLARIGAESGSFTIRDVARTITEKMTRRHPHVFADATASTPAEVLRQWEEIKRREK